MGVTSDGSLRSLSERSIVVEVMLSGPAPTVLLQSLCGGRENRPELSAPDFYVLIYRWIGAQYPVIIQGALSKR